MKKLFSFPKMVSKNPSSQPSQIVFENLPFLRSLSKTRSNHKLKRQLKLAETSQLLTIVEIALNIVKARFHLTTRQKKRLMPYADFVRRLSRCRTERGARHALVQKGAGIPTSLFAALLTPVILEITKLISSKQKTNGQ